MNDRTILAMWTATLLTVVFTVNTAFHGPNGFLAASIVTGIAGLGGFALGRIKK